MEGPGQRMGYERAMADCGVEKPGSITLNGWTGILIGHLLGVTKKMTN